MTTIVDYVVRRTVHVWRRALRSYREWQGHRWLRGQINAMAKAPRRPQW